MLLFFFFNDTATTEIYTLSLHDALPILRQPRWPPALQPGVLGSRGGRAGGALPARPDAQQPRFRRPGDAPGGDRKSTRLNSSHGYISYAVFCLKKKKIYMWCRTHHTAIY